MFAYFKKYSKQKKIKQKERTKKINQQDRYICNIQCICYDLNVGHFDLP